MPAADARTAFSSTIRVSIGSAEPSRSGTASSDWPEGGGAGTAAMAAGRAKRERCRGRHFVCEGSGRAGPTPFAEPAGALSREWSVGSPAGPNGGAVHRRHRPLPRQRSGTGAQRCQPPHGAARPPRALSRCGEGARTGPESSGCTCVTGRGLGLFFYQN